MTSGLARTPGDVSTLRRALSARSCLLVCVCAAVHFSIGPPWAAASGVIPGLVIEAHPSKPSYLLGEPVFVKLVFRNTGSEALTIREPWLHIQRAAVAMYPVRYELRAADGAIVSPRKGDCYLIGVWGSHTLTEGRPIRLEPGEFLEFWDNLLGQYPLEPGDYRAVPVYGMGLNRKAEDLPNDLWQSICRAREFGFRVVQPAGSDQAAWTALTEDVERPWWMRSVLRSLHTARGSAYEPAAAYYACEFFIGSHARFVLDEGGVRHALANDLPESFPFRDRLKDALAVNRLLALPHSERREAGIAILRGLRQRRDLRWVRAVAYACNTMVAGSDDLNASFLREIGWVGDDSQDFWDSWPPEKRPQGP